MTLNEQDKPTIIASLKKAAEELERIIEEVARIKTELYNILNDIRD